MPRLTIASIAISSILTAGAAVLDQSLVQTRGEPAVAAGKFYGYQTKSIGPGDETLDKAIALAEAEHVPLVVVWSEEDCAHCNAFITEMNSKRDEVSAFLSTNRAVFAFFKADTADNNVPGSTYRPKVVYDAYKFATETCGAAPAFPFFAFYYTRADGQKAVGGTPYGTANRDWAGFRKLYLAYLSGNDISPNYHGGRFAATGCEYDRYEAELSTTNINIELKRNTEASLRHAENLLVAIWPDGSATTNKVEWVSGEEAITVPVALHDRRFSAGGFVSLSLLDEFGAVQETNIIAMVEVENSNRNPLWLGERTASTLDWGEWTVDLDVAKAKVASADGDAYTLVSVQGSLWCPDCSNTDANFLELKDSSGKNRFREWAASNKIALAVVDIPNYSAANGIDPETCTSPSMFSKRSFMSRGEMRSGLPYLSRKMATDEAARAMRSRSCQLASTNTADGGFHRPEDTNMYRTGVPIFVVLRKDGSVAGRLVRFAAASPRTSDQGKWAEFVARFDEMLALSSDESEIENNHWSSTKAAIGSGTSVEGILAHADTSDWYEIDGATPGALARLRLSGEPAAREAVLSIAVVDDDGFSIVSTQKQTLEGAQTLAVTLPYGKRWLAGISCSNTDPGFTVDSPGTTISPYKLEASVVPPAEDPGEISFAFTEIRVIEFAETGRVQLVRTGGGFGPATVKIVCMNVDESAKGRFVWTDQVFTWQDGETGMKEAVVNLLPNETPEGEGIFTLALQKIDGNAFVSESAACNVVILDTDAPCFAGVAYEVQTYANFTTAVMFPVLNMSLRDRQIAVVRAPGAMALPTGLKFSFDIANGAVILSGVPRKAGDYEFACYISSRREGQKKTGFETTFKIKVADPSEKNPMVFEKRQSQTIPLFATDGDEARIAGVLTFAATSRGAISARFRGTESQTLSFSGNWYGIDENGNTLALLTSKGASLEIMMDTAGRIEAKLDAPGSYNSFEGILCGTADWPGVKSASAFRGYYTVAMPRLDAYSVMQEPAGAAFATLDMSSISAVKNGTFRYAGKLADGTSISGSASIAAIADDGSVATLGLFTRSAGNVFGAKLEIQSGGADKWTSSEPVNTGYGIRLEREVIGGSGRPAAYILHREANWNYMTRHEVYGSWYKPGVDVSELDAFYADYLEGDAHKSEGAPFELMFDTSASVLSERYGAILPVSNGEVAIRGRTLTLARSRDLSMSFSTRTGVFHGVVRLPFENGQDILSTYSGVVTPGWVLPCACGIDAPERPFGCGSFVFRDIVRGKPVKRSALVLMDK